MYSTSYKTYLEMLHPNSKLIKLFIFLNFVIFLLLNPTLSTTRSLHAQNKETELEEMFAIFSEEEIVVSALKRPRTVSKSPAIMSVITARQIKQMGFRTLSEILEIVPGFDVHMDREWRERVYSQGRV